MNFRQLRYFCEVVDSGTIAWAAERLFVAPTAISMQIAQLEKGFGGELFDRSVKPMALTALGRFFLPRARELLEMGQRVEQMTCDMASGKRGWLGIGFVRSLLYSVLPDAVREFRKTHPDVKVETIEMLSEQQPIHLRNGRIHIGLSRLTRATAPPADMKHTILFEDPFVVAIPSHHPLAKRSRLGLQDLADLPLISYPKDPYSAFARHVLTVLDDAGLRPTVGDEAIEIHTALRLVASGLGFALVGASVAALEQSGVTFVALTDFQAKTTVLAVTRADEDSTLAASMLSTLTSLPTPHAPAQSRRSG
ncbi:MAG: LysR family transcriptional regulator [Burkholderiales bacterium]